MSPGYCMQEGVIIHEFIHAWGFYHEHDRPDRDSYIEILWDNIKDGASGVFAKLTNAIEHGVYDYCSVMHYGSKDFSGNGQDTIRVLVSLQSRRGKVSTFQICNLNMVPTYGSKDFSPMLSFSLCDHSTF